MNTTLGLLVDPTSPLSIPVGIIIGLLASFVQSLGLTIQRKSHVLNQSLPEHRRGVEHRRPLWLLGFAIFISSNLLGSLVQIASLPVVILAPLGAVSLLWNAFFARLILGDTFSPWMILGTILIAGGAILIAVYGIVPEPTRSLEDLLELFRRPAFAAYFSTLAVLVVFCLAATHIAEFTLSRRLANFSLEDEDLTLSPSSEIDVIGLSQTSTTAGSDTHEERTDNIPTERTPLLFDRKSISTHSPTPDATLRSLNRTRLLVAISYASFSGILSGMCLIFAKSGVELLLLTLGGNNQFWRWEAWVLLLGLGVFALLQLWYLHKALVLADPTLVCPSAFCFYNLSSIVNGLVYFNQLSLILPLHLVLVILGIFILLGGVWVVSIQAGGGGVDVGPWSEEAELRVPDITFCEEPESSAEPRNTTGPINDEGQEISLSRSRRSREVRIGPVPMDRETRSESSMRPTASPMKGQVKHSLPEARPSPQPEVPQGDAQQEQPPRRRNSVLSMFTGHRPPLEAHSTLPISPTYHTRYTLRHRLTANDVQHHRGRVPSYPGSMYQAAGLNAGSTSSGFSGHHGPLSPPINPVSTLGNGLQIGLSPMSPGFTIMPRERKSRVGGLGRASSIAGNAERERNRRRTVSEGDVNARVRMGYENEMEHRDVQEAVDAGGRGEDGVDTDADVVLPGVGLHGADQSHRERERWGWIRRFVRRRKE